MTTSTTAMTATNAAQATVAATISIALSTTLNALNVNSLLRYSTTATYTRIYETHLP